jgi:hypothetical protein
LPKTFPIGNTKPSTITVTQKRMIKALTYIYVVLT